MENASNSWKITAEDEARLRRYLDLLLDANQRMNLTAVRDPEDAWDRHILDSLTLLPFLRDGRNLIDLGTGGGLPGIVLALLCPHLQVTLLEATGKKCRFLEEAAKALDLKHLTIVQDRAESAARRSHLREQFDLVTARAFAPLPVLLECAVPFATIGGRILAMKGERATHELEDAAKAMDILDVTRVAVHPTRPETGSVVVEFHKDQATDPTYPRRSGIPTKRPL